MSDPILPSAASRTRAVLLVISLCVNVALVAVVAVGIGRTLGRAMPPPGPALSPQAILREVPPDERARLQKLAAAHQPALRRARMAARRARLDATRVFAAPDFTPAAFGQSLAAVREADAALENESTAALGDLVNALTPAERQDVIERTRARSRPLRRPLWGGLFGMGAQTGAPPRIPAD